MNAQHLLEAVMQQRDHAMNQLAHAVANLRVKDDEIAELNATIERYKAAAVAGRMPQEDVEYPSE